MTARLETRTGLAALIAAMLALLILAAVATVQFERVLRETVDTRLVERARTADLLVAVGDQLATSDLNRTIDAARVVIDGRTIGVGRLPADPLPDIEQPGFRTVRADGEDWRLLAVSVDDVAQGDAALVELAAPLGDVDARVRNLRRRMALAGLLAAALAGVAGLLLGRRAARPLTDLRADAAGIGRGGGTWGVRDDYGSVEVNDVAEALNRSLAEVADAGARREAALVAARAFAASASHELRTPLQSAMTNLDVELAPGGSTSVRAARGDLDRMRSALDAVRAYSDADLVDASWFERIDLADIAEEVAARASRGADRVIVAGAESLVLNVWPDGVRLAIDNLVRNALTHGRPIGAGEPAEVVVTIDAARSALHVDDRGPGVNQADRERVILPFERGVSSVAGSGLGLAFVDRVAAAHGGRLVLADGPLGGLRATMSLPGDHPSEGSGGPTKGPPDPRR